MVTVYKKNIMYVEVFCEKKTSPTFSHLILFRPRCDVRYGTATPIPVGCYFLYLMSDVL